MTNDETTAQAVPSVGPGGPQKVFFLCFTDPVAGSQDARREHFDEHKAWVVEMEGAGHVFLAGPLLDESYQPSGSGLIVVRADSLEEAKRIVDGEPFHQRGLRTYRLVPWRINEGSFDMKVVISGGRLDWK